MHVKAHSATERVRSVFWCSSDFRELGSQAPEKLRFRANHLRVCTGHPKRVGAGHLFVCQPPMHLAAWRQNRSGSLKDKMGYLGVGTQKARKWKFHNRNSSLHRGKKTTTLTKYCGRTTLDRPAQNSGCRSFRSAS